MWRSRFRRSVGKSKEVEDTLVEFTFKDLYNATNNFSQNLGFGGFGSVYKGVLPDSTAIVVKKLEAIFQGENGERKFQSEVGKIGAIQHVNLVRLRGFCSQGTFRWLVYDFMPKGSLDSFLLHRVDNEILDWKTRYQIALGTARGLVYLHEKNSDYYNIHCDLKPENILLDAEFSPKVADFGQAMLFWRDSGSCEVLTTMTVNRPYWAPESKSTGPITAKADVYSYGMMLFEIISGRRHFAHYSNDIKIKFFKGEEIISLVDNRLEGNVDVEELTRACRVACWCIQVDEAHRPTMEHVVQILEGVLDVNQPPIPRSLRVLVDSTTSSTSPGKSSTSSLS